MNVQDKLIDRPQAVQRGSKTLFGLITFLAWGAYIYLWFPLLTLLLWLAGVRTTYLRLFDEPPAVDYQIILQLLMIAVVCAVLLTGWAEYNRFRFQGNDRRGLAPQAEIRDVAAKLGATALMAAQLQSARIGVVVMDESAVPQGVRVIQALALIP